MGFYGNITNTSNTTFQFDRIYPNRLAMDANVNNDGIFIGRYVLVEYDNKATISNIFIDTTNVVKTQQENGVNVNYYYGYTTETFNDINTRIQYKPNNRGENKNLNVYFLGEFGQVQKTEGNQLQQEYYTEFYQCVDSIVSEQDSTISYALFKYVTKSNTTDSEYIKNFAIDEAQYKEKKGYDSTVWTKASVKKPSGLLVTEYVRIADLNSVVPTFDLETDAPTMKPLVPHFDADSTNVYYKLHTQPQWGLRVAEVESGKISDSTTNWISSTYNPATGQLIPSEDNGEHDAAIYFNKAAFLSQVDVNRKTTDGIDKKEEDSQEQNYFTINPTGTSHNQYYLHTALDENGNLQKIYGEANDIQEMRINLPAIGNMMSEAWDIIYGPKRDKARTDDNGSLQGRLDSFKVMEDNHIPIKRNDDGTIIGTAINGNNNYQMPNGKNILTTTYFPLTTNDPWINVTIDNSSLQGGYDKDNKIEISQENNNAIRIRHSANSVDPTTTSWDKNNAENYTNNSYNYYEIDTNINGNQDEIKLYTPYVDATGHVVGKNIETVILPYGYKTIKVTNTDDDADLNAAQEINLDGQIADNTQDELTLSASNRWIKLDNNSEDTIKIGHEVNEINEESISDTDLNKPLRENYANDYAYDYALTRWEKLTSAGNKINIPSWSYDEAGHIISKQEHQYILPYGFKTINVINNTTESAAPAQTGIEGETADNTQDSLTFTPTNKWIKMVATGNDEIKFGHELSGIEAKEHSSSDTDIANFGDTFNILKFTTDKAGHITAVGEESIKIPSIAFTNETTGNVVTNMAYSYNSNNKTGTFTETRKNIGTLALGSYTGTTTTNGLNILSTDTISGAFNKVQIHINSLNLASTNSDLEWITDITQANGQIAIARKGTDNLKLNSYSALTSVSSINLATNDTLNNAFGKLEYRIKEEEKNRAAAIEALDVIDAEDDTKYVSGVSETNGKIAVLRKGTDTLKLNNYTIATVSSDVANGDTINSAFGKIQKQIKDIYGNEEIANNFDTIKEIADWLAANDSNADKIIDSIATLNGNDTVSGSVANSIKNAIEGLDSSKSADTNKYISGITITDGKISNITQTTLPIRTVTSGTTNGTILVNGSAINVGGLKSAAYTESSAYAKSDVLDTKFEYGTEQKTIQNLMDIVKAQEETINNLTTRIENLENPPQDPDNSGDEA